MILRCIKSVYLILLLASIQESESYKSSLTIAIDNTPSMFDEIIAVQNATVSILNTVQANDKTQIANFVLLTFNDQGDGDAGVVIRANTDDPGKFTDAVSDINFSYDFEIDCPENALSGTIKALEQSLDRSLLYVFTDAAAKDYNKSEEVLAIAQDKQTPIVFILTGNCHRVPENSLANLVYNNLADDTNGHVFRISKSNIGKVLPFVKMNVKGRNEDIFRKKLPPGKHNATITTDPMMRDITLSLASATSNTLSVAVKAPDGSTVSVDVVIETDTVMVYSINVTIIGVHILEVNTQTETNAVVSAQSGIDFQFGFSIHKPTSLADTKIRPLPDLKSFLAIKLNEGDITLQAVQILDMNRNIKMKFNLELINERDKFYITQAFYPPKGKFQIAVVGHDTKSDSEIIRTSSTPLEIYKNIPGDQLKDRSPIVKIVAENTVLVNYGSDINLKCEINCYPKPEVIWKNKNNGKEIVGQVYIDVDPYQYTSVLKVEKVYENVTYECRGQNPFGSDVRQVNIKTVSPKFDVIKTPKRTLIKHWEDGNISCIVDANPPANITWYKDGALLTQSMFVENSENKSVLKIKNAKKSHGGKYICEARNQYNRTLVEKYVDIIADCFVDTKKLTKLHPMVLTSSLKWPLLQKFDNYLIFPQGEQLTFFCPTRFAMFPKQYLTGYCDYDMNILIDQEKYNYLDLKCDEEVEHTVQKTGIECMPGNTEKISIGFDLKDGKTAEVYEICWNKKTETPIYAKHIMRSTLAEDDYDAAWSNSDHFLMNLEEAFECKSQIKSISEWLHRPFHKDDGCCFAKRQLVNFRDVFPGAPQKSTFSYFNVVPHWSTCNDDNWKEIERKVRRLVKISGELFVWTGVAKELELSSPRFTNTPFFVDYSGNHQPVPRFLWKVIQNPADQSSLAIIQVNIPDLLSSDVSKYVLCDDICDSIDWLKNSNWHDVNKGYTYCCSIEQFETAFGFKGTFGIPKGRAI